jgi:hypothetical protein
MAALRRAHRPLPAALPETVEPAWTVHFESATSRGYIVVNAPGPREAEEDALGRLADHERITFTRPGAPA